jgi:hypothetical protein
VACPSARVLSTHPRSISPFLSDAFLSFPFRVHTSPSFSHISS